ncbi:MAG TPA: hypothetical protein PKC18_09930 [Lacipirellulaceae bacterium]|nr:hypothetical protein [Lacipirellulaceae bacterium]HMP06414.1 hypothetical protein [Lacipirellulaceae bacterium]
MIYFGRACQRFLDLRMQGLKLTHLQFDGQWTLIGKKLGRRTVQELAQCHD